jgi:signal transduction histidine kinase
VTLRMMERAGFVWVVVQDNGPGFTPSREAEAVDDGHFGLVGIRERLASLGGHAEITSAPGAGTRVALIVPAAVPLPVEPRLPPSGDRSGEVTVCLR